MALTPRQIKAEQYRRRKYEQIRYFQPHAGQKAAIELMAEDGAFIVVAASGNGWGKSVLLAATLGAIIWPDLAPPCFGHTLFKQWPHPKRARIISTPKEVEEIGTLQTEIKRLWPLGRYSADKKGKSYPSQFKSDTGWVVDVMTYEQAVGEFAGPTLGFICFNEPMPEPIWRESLARMRKGGIILVAMTSLSENPWVVSGILDRANGKDIRVRYGDVEENCADHSPGGHLPHEQVERILAQYPQDERESRKTGKPLSFAGRIHKPFDISVHVAKSPIQPQQLVSHFQIVDPASGKPFFITYLFLGHDGITRIWKEWPDYDFMSAPDPGMTVKDYARLFKELESGQPISRRIMDRRFKNQRRSPGGPTLGEEFMALGYDFEDSYAVAEGEPEMLTGILKVNDLLRYNPDKPIDSINRPRLEVSPECRNTIRGLNLWSRDPKTGKPLDNRFKDPCDNVRYYAMSDPQPLEREETWTEEEHIGLGRHPHEGAWKSPTDAGWVERI